MTDEKIYDLFHQREDKICERFEHNLKTLTEFIAVENQTIKKSIDALTEKVERQNSSVKKLNEWKAEVEGGEEALQKFTGAEHNKTIRYVAIASICVSFIAVGATLFNSCVTGRMKDDIDNKLHWKQDRMPDSTVRAGRAYDITQDTAFIRNLEEDTKKYRK